MKKETNKEKEVWNKIVTRIHGNILQVVLRFEGERTTPKYWRSEIMGKMDFPSTEEGYNFQFPLNGIFL